MNLTIKTLAVLFALIGLPFLVLWAIKPNDYWVYNAKPVLKGIEISLYLRGERHFYKYMEGDFGLVTEFSTKLDSRNVILPFGSIELLDLTWPPGDVRLKFGDEIINLKPNQRDD